MIMPRRKYGDNNLFPPIVGCVCVFLRRLSHLDFSYTDKAHLNVAIMFIIVN